MCLPVSGQHPVARQAEHIIDLVGFAPCHDLGSAIMAVVAQRDPGSRPVAPDALDQPADMASDLGHRRCLAGAQQHRHRPACRGVVNVDRQEAACSGGYSKLLRTAEKA